MVKLGEISSPKQWRSLPKSAMTATGYPVYGANGRIGWYSEYTHEHPVIAIGCRGSIGSVHLSEPRSYITSNAMALDSLRTDLVDRNFLLRFLSWRGFRDVTSGSSQPQLTRQNIVKIDVPLPTLTEQRRIAAILDKADAIRTKRRQTLARLGELKVSLFDSMFYGKGYATAPLNDVCLRRGEYGSTVASTEISDDLPRYVRITDIQEDGNLSGEARGPAGASSEWNRYLLNDGDILFARSGATVGKTFLYRSSDGPCVFAGYLIRFVPNTKLVDPAFLFSFTRTSRYKSWVAARQNVVAQPNINAKQYGSELMVPLPPIEYQKEFARRVKAIDNISANVKEILEQDDALFASLQSRAFKGEL
nr:restriction endonuclease subunit S [Dermabacter vaginalis]